MEQPQHDPENSSAPVTDHDPDDENPMLWCPVCSKKLETLKCKLFCRDCGYYMSCADYY